MTKPPEPEQPKKGQPKGPLKYHPPRDGPQPPERTVEEVEAYQNSQGGRRK